MLFPAVPSSPPFSDSVNPCEPFSFNRLQFSPKLSLFSVDGLTNSGNTSDLQSASFISAGNPSSLLEKFPSRLGEVHQDKDHSFNKLKTI